MKNLVTGIYAHVDAGKTTLTEALLYKTGAIRTLGRVDHKDAFLDDRELERERGITIFSKEARLTLKDVRMTILDTPGHVDFSAETERTMQVLDYAILVISGTDGVQGHTRTLWNLLRRHHLPVFIFVNKMDLAGADREAVLSDLKSELSENCCDFSSAFSENEARHSFLEDISLTDEAMMEKMLSDDDIPDAMIRDAVFRGKLFPVFFGSALKLEGVDDFIRGMNTFTEVPSRPEEFGARVYKILRDSHGTRFTCMKITGGSLKSKMEIEVNGEKEKVDQIYLFSGQKAEQVHEVPAGDVCAVSGLIHTYPGQGLGTERIDNRPVLEPVMTYKMIPPLDVNPGEFYRKIKDLEEEIPELHLLWNEEAGEIQVQIMGQVQLEVLTELIADRFGTKVSFGEGAIVYKETIVKPQEGVGHFEPLRHYAEVHLLLEPLPRGSGIQIGTVCSTDVLSAHWQNLILTHLTEVRHRGVLTGSEITDMRITLLSGRAHPKHTEGGDFRQATYRAIRQGLMSAENLLLEPYFQFTLDIPQDLLGRAMSDLDRFLAKTDPPKYRQKNGNGFAELTGKAPVSTISGYVEEVRAYTHGTGTLTLMPGGYDVCHNPEEVIRAFHYDPEADTDHPTGSVFCSHGSGFVVPWNLVPEYMHLPYAYVPDRSEPDNDQTYFDAENGFGRGSHGPSEAARKADAEELEAIYQREFGHKSETEIAGSRKKWSRERTAPSVHQKYDKKGQPIYPKKDDRREMLIVDGYNIIYSWPELKAILDENIDSARGRLLDIISNYQGYTGKRTMVVFDAYKTDRTPESYMKYNNLEIVFTKKDETADAFIEKTVHDTIKDYRITVATSDGLEQLTVMRLGALRMSARMLKEDVERVTKHA